MRVTGMTSYLMHYLDLRGLILMLLVASCAIGASLVLIYLRTVRLSKRYTPDTRGAFIRDEFASLSERFYELIFSSTSILLFVGIYFTIDYFGIAASYRNIWAKYSSFLLLGFILASVILNSFIDSKVVPLVNVRPGERSAMRLLGMIYMLFIFVYIKFIYQDDNYDTIILYFLTLVIGRFVYFDTSLESFSKAMQDALRNTPLLILALLCTGIMAFCGFHAGYLMKANGVVLSLFIAHLFLVTVITVVYRSGMLNGVGKEKHLTS